MTRSGSQKPRTLTGRGFRGVSTPLSDAALRIVGNARRLGTPAHACAFALDLVAPEPDRRWLPVCVWCFERIERSHPHPDSPCTRVAGDCSSCPVSGRDVLVAALPISCLT